MPDISAPKTLSSNRTQFTVTLTAEETKQAEDKALEKLSQQTTIPGFRVGKAPAAMVRSRVDEGALVEETVRSLLPGYFRQLAESHKLQPIVPPKVEVESRSPLKITITFVGRPDVKVKEGDTIIIAKKEPKFDDKDIDRMVEYLQTQYRTTKPVERGAREGDQVTMNFVGTDTEGKEIQGTRATGYQVVIGSKTLLPGFEENLAGLAPGQEKTFSLVFPEKYHAEHLRSKPVTFAVTVTGVAEVTTPAMTDAFVQEHKLAESVPHLRQTIADSMRKQEEEMDHQRRENELFDKIRANTTVELAPELIEQEERAITQEMVRQLEERKLTVEKWLEQTKRTPESLQKEIQGEAAKRLTLRFGIEAVMEQKEIRVTDEEVTAMVQAIAASLQGTEQREFQKNAIPGSDQWEELRWRRRVEKLVEAMLG